jgi:hypothetical protein
MPPDQKKVNKKVPNLYLYKYGFAKGKFTVQLINGLTYKKRVNLLQKFQLLD